MKKWFALIVFMSMLLPVCADTAEDNGLAFLQNFYPPYSKREMFETINALKPLNYYQIPAPFWYLTKQQEPDNEVDMLVFRLAEKKYKQYRQNFAAVFNYATLRMSLNADADDLPDCSPAQLQEAYRLLEEAKKLRPDYLPVYAQQDLLLELQIFGIPVYILYPQYNIYQDNPLIPVYRKQKDLARKRLAVQEKLLAFGQGDVITAYEISVALGLEEKAAIYKDQARTLVENLDLDGMRRQGQMEIFHALEGVKEKMDQTAEELRLFFKELRHMSFGCDTAAGTAVSRRGKTFAPLTPEERFIMEEELNRRMEGRMLFRGLPSK